MGTELTSSFFHETSSQGIRHRFGDHHVGEFIDEAFGLVGRAVEIHPAIIVGAAGQLFRIASCGPLHQHALGTTDHACEMARA
jgi:hypothetical protein